MEVDEEKEAAEMRRAWARKQAESGGGGGYAVCVCVFKCVCVSETSRWCGWGLCECLFTYTHTYLHALIHTPQEANPEYYTTGVGDADDYDHEDLVKEIKEAAGMCVCVCV
jgi:hypothetical protein